VSQQWHRFPLLQQCVPTVTSVTLLHHCVPTITSVPIVAAMYSDNDLASCGLSSSQEKRDRQTYVDRPIRCSSLTLGGSQVRPPDNFFSVHYISFHFY
jgi:hypothetical protein